MSPEHLRRLLERLRAGELTTDGALSELKHLSFEDVGFAKIDHHRRIRQGYPEVVYGEGKTPAQVAQIFASLAEKNSNVLCTRASPAT
ncbi:MAG: 1-(5-phosphoribosyl)-5-amino-4-imidazole-carboxylate carboxylase, partial [Deltaproteobacteria bacterium]|nr:1-(5-phosphoribosyl)-5-amino-4-imidazole-carboxylate carboxylase [Deltaproteobacteria bacterium]